MVVINGVEYTPMKKEALHDIKKGDVLERMLGFCIPVYIIVQEIKGDIIDAGWTFNRNTGFEVDEDIPTPPEIAYIRRVLTDEQKKILDDGAKVVPFP